MPALSAPQRRQLVRLSEAIAAEVDVTIGIGTVSTDQIHPARYRYVATAMADYLAALRQLNQIMRTCATATHTDQENH